MPGFGRLDWFGTGYPPTALRNLKLLKLIPQARRSSVSDNGRMVQQPDWHDRWRLMRHPFVRTAEVNFRNRLDSCWQDLRRPGPRLGCGLLDPSAQSLMVSPSADKQAIDARIDSGIEIAARA
jgi:DNA-binding transcriptional regulator PaaX